MPRTKLIAVSLALSLLAISLSTRAEDAPAPATQSTADARIAELETKLAAAIERIEALEAEVAKRTNGAPNKPPVPAKPAKPTPSSKVDNSTSYFPKGTQVTGTMHGSKVNNIAMKGSVTNRTATTAFIRMTNTFGTRDFEIVIKNGEAALASTRVVSVANGGPPNQLLEIKVKGKVDAESLKLSGTWRVKGPAGNYVTDVEFDLKAN